MNDLDTAMRIVKGAVELAPYPSFVKNSAVAAAEQQLRADPNRTAALLRLTRDALFPCGHTAQGCPSCGGVQRVETAAQTDPKEVGERVADKLRNAN